jgi:hypothetical protein
MLIRRGAAGDEMRATELLEGAAEGYEELGMTAWTERAMADLAGIADSAPTSADSDRDARAASRCDTDHRSGTF